MGRKGQLPAHTVKKRPKITYISLAIRKLQRFLWRLWKQKVRNCCNVRARVRARERFSQIVRICLLLPVFTLLQNVGDFPKNVGDFPKNVGDFPKNVGDFPNFLRRFSENVGVFLHFLQQFAITRLVILPTMMIFLRLYAETLRQTFKKKRTRESSFKLKCLSLPWRLYNQP